MNDHYFSARPGSDLAATEVRGEVWGHRLQLLSAGGVFAHGRIDIGTSVLFRSMPPPSTGATFLDLGCGYGVIACALALARPAASVWAVDVNERAVQLTTQNARRIGAEDRVTAALPDDVPADLRFDEIWSNPPIRIGKSALHQLWLRWLPHLAPDGRAVLVVAKNLGADSLQRWFAEQGWPCERVRSSKGFRVLEVRRPT